MSNPITPVTHSSTTSALAKFLNKYLSNEIAKGTVRPLPENLGIHSIDEIILHLSGDKRDLDSDTKNWILMLVIKMNDNVNLHRQYGSSSQTDVNATVEAIVTTAMELDEILDRCLSEDEPRTMYDTVMMLVEQLCENCRIE